MKDRYQSKDGERLATVTDYKGAYLVTFYTVDKYGASRESSLSPDGSIKTKKEATKLAKEWCK